MSPADAGAADGTSAGLLVVVEGADGSGKSTLVAHLVRKVRQQGRDIHRLRREEPGGPAEYADLITSVGRLFRAAHGLNASFEVLSLAAAAQYAALLEGEVLKRVQRGQIVVAESWWAKTWIRLRIEARRRSALPESDWQRFGAWQRSLLPEGLLPQVGRLTILVEAEEEDRREWYEQSVCPGPVYDASGSISRAPSEFAAFTTELANTLREIAHGAGWPILQNGRSRDIDEVCDEFMALIDKRLEKRQ